MGVPGGETISLVYSNSQVCLPYKKLRKLQYIQERFFNRNIITASNEEVRNFCVRSWSTVGASACYANHMVVYMSL